MLRTRRVPETCVSISACASSRSIRQRENDGVGHAVITSYPGKRRYGLFYREEGGDLPAERSGKSRGLLRLGAEGNSEAINVFSVRSLGVCPIVECGAGFAVLEPNCGAMAAIRQAFRFPEAASTATVSG